MASAISAYVGPNGHGKTLLAIVLEVVPAVKAGVPILSTVPLDVPGYVRLGSWLDIWGVRDCLVFLDDVSAQLPSRQSHAVPAQLLMKLNSLRHDGVTVVWTAPAWGRADVALREVTQAVTTCRGYLADSFERVPGTARLRRPSGDKLLGADRQPVLTDSRWPPRRLFRYKTYDAVNFDNFTQHAIKDVRPVKSGWYYRPFRPEQLMYDTLAPVSLLDHVDQAGSCVVCGGKRAARRCVCAAGAGVPAPTMEVRRVGPVPVPALDGGRSDG